jgi:alkyl hydroperoxide reductase subunit AhpC
VSDVAHGPLVYCRINTPRKQGGLGAMKIPLLADKTLEISKAYGVLKEDEGISFRWVIDAVDFSVLYVSVL